MDDFRSRAYGDKNMQLQVYNGGGRGGSTAPQDFRSYSTPHAVAMYNEGPSLPPPVKFKNGRSMSGSSSASKTGGWGLSDPEFQRKKRVASYKAYSVESKMKGQFRKSFRWIKDRFNQVVYGRW